MPVAKGLSEPRLTKASLPGWHSRDDNRVAVRAPPPRLPWLAPNGGSGDATRVWGVHIDSFAGDAFGRQRRFAEAESSFKAAEPALGRRSRGLALVRALQGKQAEARAIPNEIERDWRTTYVVPEMSAWAYDALDDRARMYGWLRRGIEVQVMGGGVRQGDQCIIRHAR